mmetsp:Transcript_108506/g.192189  ORF Transcript_108506/g.192189 Transcript_108506/m.192189 type:complete len:186 (+) Transcript_108506:52-609(+)
MGLQWPGNFAFDSDFERKARWDAVAIDEHLAAVHEQRQRGRRHDRELAQEAYAELSRPLSASKKVSDKLENFRRHGWSLRPTDGPWLHSRGLTDSSLAASAADGELAGSWTFQRPAFPSSSVCAAAGGMVITSGFLWCPSEQHDKARLQHQKPSGSVAHATDRGEVRNLLEINVARLERLEQLGY